MTVVNAMKDFLVYAWNKQQGVLSKGTNKPTPAEKRKLESQDDYTKLSKEEWQAAKKKRKKERGKMLKIAKKEAKLNGRAAMVMPAVPKVHSYKPDIQTNPKGSAFSSLKKYLSRNTMEFISKLSFEKMTNIQAIVIPLLAAGTNVKYTSPPATGKSLSFLIPAMDRLHKTSFKKSAGAGVIILCPNLGLCHQSKSQLDNLLLNTTSQRYTTCVAAGGSQLDTEAHHVKCANILFCTPASLHEHLDNTCGFSIDQVMYIVLDEYDILLSHYDYLPHVHAIRSKLPKKYQMTMLSSTRGSEDEDVFALLMGGRKFADVDLTADLDCKLSPGVLQEYVLCPTHYRLPILQKVLLENPTMKTVVFCMLSDTIQLCSGLLTVLGVNNTALHDGMDGSGLGAHTLQWSGVLLCRDVDVLGWHLQDVERVVHLDPPLSPSMYAHRVGVAARAPDAKGVSIALLRPEETCFLELLQEQLGALLLRRNVALGHLSGQLATMHMAVHNTPGLESTARRAASLYRNSYRRLKPKTMFPFQGLHNTE
ncbi:DEAD/DEAH box helicase domain, partial [Trinorchestia longiramus]